MRAARIPVTMPPQDPRIIVQQDGKETRRIKPRLATALSCAVLLCGVVIIIGGRSMAEEHPSTSATVAKEPVAKSAAAKPTEARQAVSVDNVDNLAELFPANAPGYLEISNPSAFVEIGSDERIWNELRQVADVRQALESNQFQQFQAVVGLLEGRLGAKWPAVVDGVTGGGIAVTIEPIRQTVLMAVKAKNADQLTQLHAEILALTQGNPNSSIREVEFEGASGWSFGPEEFHCIVDGLLLVSNREAGVNSMLDKLNDGGNSLAADAAFQQARDSSGGAAVWGFAKLDVLRILPQFQQAVSGPSNNPGAEIIAGGVLDVLAKASHVSFSANFADGDVQLKAELPFDEDVLSDRRGWYFSDSNTAAKPALNPPGTIFSLSTYRDFSRFWLSRDDLFEDVTLAQLSQADTQLGTYFTGLEFGRDVLGAFEPGMRLVVAKQDFDNDAPVPAAKFPAVAIVMEMKDGDSFWPQLLTAYQKTIGVVNIVGGMSGQPNLLLGTEEHSGAQLWKGTYIPDPNTNLAAAPVYYNLSPSCVRVENHVVISSTVDLAKDLVDELKSGDDERTAENSMIRTDFTVLADVLNENRATLVAQNMLEGGRTQEEAEAQIDLLIRLLQNAKPLAIDFAATNGKLTLRLETGLAD